MASRKRMLVTGTAAALLLVTPSNAAAARTVVGITVVSDAGEHHGVCTLVHRAPRDRAVVLSFLTAASLFLRDDGSHAYLHSIVIDPTGDRLDATSDDVSLPAGRAVDVAIVRAAAKTSTLAPIAIHFTPPSVGAAFAIEGPPGAVDRLVEHVRFASALQLVGDRDASELDACTGAPAIDVDGVFGIVCDCRPQRAPIVSLLPLARAFLAEHLPGLAVPHDTVNRR